MRPRRSTRSWPSSETPGRDASLDFSTGQPVVTPSQDGRGVDYEATLKDLLAVLTGTGERKITAVYADQPAELTTEELNKPGHHRGDRRVHHPRVRPRLRQEHPPGRRR